MLRINYQDRQSASDYLGEVYRLGFHAIQTIEVRRITLTRNTTGQDYVKRTKSVITQLRQNTRSDSDVSSGFYDIGGAWEKPEVTPSKRDLREGVHFYNLASPRSLARHAQEHSQIKNHQTEDKDTSTRSKRRRPQTTQSPTTGGIGRGPSKRSRASVSCEADEQLWKASGPRQGPEQLERSVSSNHGGPLATEVASLTQDIESIPQVAPKPLRKPTRPLRSSSTQVTEGSLEEIEKPSPKRNIQDHVRAMLTGNQDDKNKGQAKVHHP